MITNYIRVFFRNFKKNKFYYSINIFGLAIGFACSIIAFLYIKNEISYDKFNENYENTYRIYHKLTVSGKEQNNPSTVYEIGDAICNQLPEAEAHTKLLTWFNGGMLIKRDNDYFSNISILYTDTNFLKIFSYEILLGNKNNFLQEANQVAITAKVGKKLYGDQNPIGKAFTLEGKEYKVGWLMADIPSNSSLFYDVLISFDNAHFDVENSVAFDLFTYFKFTKKLTPATIKKAKTIGNKIINDNFGQFITSVDTDFINLGDIYLSGGMGWEPGKVGNKKNLYIFGALAFFILLIAIINFVNLMTAKSENRGKEVGLRKVVGATKKNLRFQFIGESIIITLIALSLSLVFAEFLIHPVNNNLNTTMSVFGQTTIAAYFCYIIAVILIGIIAGTYPAFILSRFKTINILKGIYAAKGNPNLLKVILVIIQFSLSTILITSISIFTNQINYLKTKDLGFDAENLIVIDNNSTKVGKNFKDIKQKLLANPNIKSVASSLSVPGGGTSGQMIHLKGQDPKEGINIRELKVQDDFIETYGIKLLEGKSFKENMQDSNSFILNEAAVKKMGLEDPIGKEVVIARWTGKVIGVVKDFHYYTLKEELSQLVISRYNNYVGSISVRITPNKIDECLNHIRNTLHEFDNDFYWNYKFIDQIFKSKYRVEERLFNILLYGGIIAIILSILGLYALTSYTINKKHKEIGIRKVQGASVGNIVFMLNRNILRWVLLTNIIAWPLSFYLMNSWLNNFANRIDIHIGFFIFSGALSFLIAYLTIITQARKAALLNPAVIIRYE